MKKEAAVLNMLLVLFHFESSLEYIQVCVCVFGVTTLIMLEKLWKKELDQVEKFVELLWFRFRAQFVTFCIIKVDLSPILQSSQSLFCLQHDPPPAWQEKGLTQWKQWCDSDTPSKPVQQF